MNIERERERERARERERETERQRQRQRETERQREIWWNQMTIYCANYKFRSTSIRTIIILMISF